MNRLIPLMLLATLVSACASNGMMPGSDKMMMDDSKNKTMENMDMKKDGMMGSMPHDSMMQKDSM